MSTKVGKIVNFNRPIRNDGDIQSIVNDVDTQFEMLITRMNNLINMIYIGNTQPASTSKARFWFDDTNEVFYVKVNSKWLIK